jgi:hypothetical protein
MRKETALKQRLFLRAVVREGGNMAAASAAAGLHYRGYRNWLSRKERFPDFARQFKIAKRKGLQVRRQQLRDAIHDRALKGRPQYVKSKDGGLQSYPWSAETGFVDYEDERYTSSPGKFKMRTLVEYVPSDSLLIFETNKQMPSYRSKQQVALTGADGGPLKTSHETRHTVDYDAIEAELQAIGNRMARRVTPDGRA